MPYPTAFQLVLLAVLGGCASAPVVLAPADQAVLDGLSRTPEQAGASIYDGEVFAAHGDAPEFEYQRRVRERGAQQISTHITRPSTAHAVIIALTATHDRDFALIELEQIDAQRGIVGFARMQGARHLVFERRRGHRVRARVETVDDPVVVGPTLFGWTLAHWDDLLAGEALRVRFAVIDDARSYGFELRMTAHDDATTVVSMRARSPIVRAAVPTMRIVVDSATRKILRYEGRVPPRRLVGGRLRPFDARVEYRYSAARYR